MASPGRAEEARASVDMPPNHTAQAAMSRRSLRVIPIRMAGGALDAPRRGGRPALRRGRRGQQVRRQGEEREERDQDDGELEQPALDAAAAPVDRRVAAERAAEARPAGLEQDREDQGDGDEQLADGQNGIHVRGTSLVEPPDGSTGSGSSSERPAISGQGGTPAMSRIVGATSARTPSRRVRPSK